MFDAPRCREWTPLATQQLRLRSLIQIVGYNIRPPERGGSLPAHRCSYYYTLHETVVSAPFYTSEMIVSPHPKWRELHTDITQRKASNNVVIQIWCHILEENEKVPNENSEINNKSDVIIQTWGVYFSGLRLIGANLALDFTSDSFKINTLVFQMHGGYFCSYKSLNLEVIPTENLYEYSISSDSSKHSSQRIPIEANFLKNHTIIKEARSLSPSKRSHRSEDVSKSNSPTERGFKQCFKAKPTSSININIKTDDHPNSFDDVKVFTMNDSNCDLSKQSSREDLYNSNVDLSETAESFDLKQDSVPKCRYLCLNFLKSEIRPSYNAKKLQDLHLLQYAIKKKKDAVEEIKEKIYRKSPIKKEIFNDDYLTAAKVKKRRNLFDEEENIDCEVEGKEEEKEKVQVNGPRLTLKLNDLLSFKTQPSPTQRLEHARLTKRLEIVRFRRRLLADERDYKMAAVERLREKYARILEENQDIGSVLMSGYHALSRRAERLSMSQQSAAAMRELVARAQAALYRRRCELPCELADMFRIDCDAENRWWICDVHLPIFDDDAPKRMTRPSDPVAAGYAAHCTKVAASILGQPLRYKIKVKGSESIIFDELTQELPDPRIPLYPRGGDPMLFRYGVFLLNKNIAQLLWAKGVAATDIRPTLSNLKRLLTGNRMCESTLPEVCFDCQSPRSLVASDRRQLRAFNRFKVDCHSSMSEYGLTRHRHSRSVGSCKEEREIRRAEFSPASAIGSEPSLNERNAPIELKFKRLYLKQHNSDSQLSRLATFTIGNETLDNTKPALVKISSNNGDGIVTDVKCEIDDDCRQIGESTCNEKIEMKECGESIGNEKGELKEGDVKVDSSGGKLDEAVENEDCDNDLEDNACKDNLDVNIDECCKYFNNGSGNFDSICKSDGDKDEFKSTDNNEFSVKEEMKSKSLDSDKTLCEFVPRLVEKVMAVQHADAVKEIELGEMRNCDCQVETQFSMDDAHCDKVDTDNVDKISNQ